jgi:hypothetical protein
MTTSTATIESWFIGRLPASWTASTPVAVVVDRDEITVTITVDEPTLPDDAADADRAEAVLGRIVGFREDTREQRIQIAREA